MAFCSNLLKADENENRCLSDLLKISFRDGNYVANSGKNICTVPSECMEELLSSLHLIQVKNLQRAHENQSSKSHKGHSYEGIQFKKQAGSNDGEQQAQEGDKATPIKVGQIFYIQFYFTRECVYYDHHHNKLVLSRDKRTAFKIIEHLTKTVANSKEQTYDYIGNVVPNEHRYLIVIANELLYLKYTDHSVYLGTYDEKCIVTFSHSIFRIDKHPKNTPLLKSPCRLYSVEQEKYVVFDIKNNEIVLKDESVCVQGMCIIETAQFHYNEAESPTLPFHRKKSRAIVDIKQEDNKQIAIRVLQGSNRYYLAHQNNSTEKLAQDLGRMLNPIQERLNNSNTFLKRYEPTFTLHKPETTFNLSNISNIQMAGPLGLLEEEEREQMVEDLTLREVEVRGMGVRAREELCFLVQFYPSYNDQHQLFIYETISSKEKVWGREVVREKQLYLDYREVVSSGKQQCVLKEYNSQKMRRESSKYKNILRVEFIGRDMLTPYLHYYSLLLNLKIYNYYRQPHASLRSSQERYKLRLNLAELQEVLTDFYDAMRTLAETNKEKAYWLLRELLEINFAGILEELFEAIIARKQREEREQAQSPLKGREESEEYAYETIESIQFIAKIILFVGRIMPERLIAALLRTDRCLLFMRLCKFQDLHRFFVEEERICLGEPAEMLGKLQRVLQGEEGSRWRNICILWAYRLIKGHQLQSAEVEAEGQRLMGNHRGRLSEDYLIVLELIKVWRGELFYSREVLRFLPLQRLQQEEVPFALRQAYFSRIIGNYRESISLPFRPRLALTQQAAVVLEKDNQAILRTYLEEVLPKNCKFETVENKLLALQSCELYLAFGEGLLEEIAIEDQGCREYLPLLVSLLEEHLQQYYYEEQLRAKYIMQLLKCLQLALEKHLRLVLYEESELAIDDEELLLRNCLESFTRIAVTSAAHAASRATLEPVRNSKTKDEQGILSFFSLRKPAHSAEKSQCVDKEMVWEQLQEGRLATEERLDIFERVVNLATLLLSPSLRLREAYRGLIASPPAYSVRLMGVLELLARKAHQHELWPLVEKLGESYSDEEWRTIVAVINCNQLLTHFIIIPPRQQLSPLRLATLYRVLNEILLRYLDWTNSRITDRPRYPPSHENYKQLEISYRHSSNDLEPQNFLGLLAKIEPSYMGEEMALHLTILRSLGVITSLAFYNFYSQYVIRYECQNLHTPIVRLGLAFMAALTPPLRVDFANNLQYSLFKQGEQLKALVCSLAGLKEEEAVQDAPQRATNFNILTELNDRRVSRVTFSSEDSEKEFLVGLFRLLGEVEAASSTHKEILPKLGYKVVVGVLMRYSGETLLKHELLKFVLASVQKQMTYGLNKYLKAGEEGEQPEEEEDSQERVLLLDFVKHSNYLLQRQTDAFKGLNLPTQRTEVLISYSITLLALVRIRDRILSYLKYEHSDKTYRSDSGVSQAHSFASRSLTSQDAESLLSGSIVGREEEKASARTQQMLNHYTAEQIDESEVENIEGINKLLCYEVLEALDALARDCDLPANLQEPLQWVENHYKISLTSPAALAEPAPKKQLLYKLDKSYLNPAAVNHRVLPGTRYTFVEEGRNQGEVGLAAAPHYQAINSFLSLKLEGYLVLLIQLLQRYLLMQEKQGGKAWPDGQILHLMVLIQAELNEQIEVHKLQEEQFGKRDFEVLPEKFYKRLGFESVEESAEEKEHQGCCQLPAKKMETLFELLLLAHRLDKPLFLLYLQAILERATFYNVANQASLQRIITANFPLFYELVFGIVHRFSTLSPIADDTFFILSGLLDRERMVWERIYEGEGGCEVRGEEWAQGLRGTQGFHLASLNYYMLVKMLQACSRTLNFEFKSLFARPTIERESVLSELIDVLDALMRNLYPLSEEKLEFTRVSLKLINTFLRGPVEPNIEIAINRGYSGLLVRILGAANGEGGQGERAVLLGIKRLVAEGLFILIPFVRLGEEEVKVCEKQLRESYIRSKKAYSRGQYDGVISDFVERREGGNHALLYFQLALNFYYCLIEIYEQRGNSRIVDVQVELLARQRREKQRRKNWMVFYQVYEVIVAIVDPLMRRVRGTYEELTDGRSEEELLRRAIVFFTRHVSQVEVRVYGKTKKISFLLLQEASCYNISIRKEFYRLIGKEQRQLRLNRFMKVSKYIIIRLEISKTVRRALSHFKPLEVVVLNRQLWKSLCFLTALLLNVLFVFQDTITDFGHSLYSTARYAITAFSFLFVVFLYLIYFLEVLPLKVKVYSILRRRGFKTAMLLIFVKDKTLGFAVFYSVFLGLSFYMTGFVSALLFDYLFRFKVSSKITFLMFRSMPKIFYVFILLFTLLYTVALVSIRQEERNDACNTVAACTQVNFFIFMDLRFNVKLPYVNNDIVPIITVLPRLFLKVITLSLLVGIIFMEKRKEDQQTEAQAVQVRDVCFICGGQRNALEKARNSNKGFDRHVEMDHNLWNYVYYLVYLKNKQRKNLNAIEGMIIEQWDTNQIHWLPDHFQ